MRKVLSFLLLLAILSSPVETARSAAVRADLLAARVGQLAGPAITEITTNLGQYSAQQVPQYAKLEISFQVDTQASNPQMPYDPAPPPGIEPGIGVSVDAQFSRDGWRTFYTQPAFYYQVFDDQVKSGREWFYPTNRFVWKVRFAPTEVGEWQFRLAAQDASGIRYSTPQSFQVAPSDRHGFVRVSQKDPRYFELDDGTYFPGLGYNMIYDNLSWTNPVLDNLANFERMSENGVQLVRIWLSRWSIYGAAWNPWNSPDPAKLSVEIPYHGITFTEAYPGSDVSMQIDASKNACMYIGILKPQAAVKRNTTYRVRIRYKTAGITGPVQSGKPYGFVAKIGPKLWGGSSYCYLPGTGTIVTPYQSQDTGGWQILEGELTTGEEDFLPRFYLVMENSLAGSAYVDYVWIEEVLGDGSFGPNIVSKPWMAHHLYMEQRASYAFDKVLELAEQYGIYIRPVILEKNEYISNRIDFEGNPILPNPLCEDDDLSNNPEKCPGNRWFYGNYREVAKTRWLQQAWWRYLQARWGYSTSIHSWELLNEGNPTNERHYVQADELGKTMRQFYPNHHLVSTSFYHSFPGDAFWGSLNYPNVDFADYHRYGGVKWPPFYDIALWSYETSMQYGALQPKGAHKPLIRGETGFAADGVATQEFKADRDNIWLHKFIWAAINPGGMIESYWYATDHIYRQDAAKNFVFDYRYHYKTYYNFIQDIPLNNGHYQDAAALSSNENLRPWGQKDLVNGQAHLWLQNANHTWKNVVDGVEIPPVSGQVRLNGFAPGETYQVTWWDPYQPDLAQQILQTERLTAEPDGSISLMIDNLVRDIALKLGPAPVPPPLAPTPTIQPPTPTVTTHLLLPTATALPTETTPVAPPFSPKPTIAPAKDPESWLYLPLLLSRQVR